MGGAVTAHLHIDSTSLVHRLPAHAKLLGLLALVLTVVAIPAGAQTLDELIAGLQRLRYTRHDVIVLHVMDYDELEFPFQDNIMFEYSTMSMFSVGTKTNVCDDINIISKFFL